MAFEDRPMAVSTLFGHNIPSLSIQAATEDPLDIKTHYPFSEIFDIETS